MTREREVDAGSGSTDEREVATGSAGGGGEAGLGGRADVGSGDGWAAAGVG